MGTSINATPKGTSLHGNTSHDVKLVKIRLWVPGGRDKQRFPMLFNGADNPKNCPFLWKFAPRLIMIPWAHPTTPSIDLYSHIRKAHEYDQQTDKHTVRPRYSLCSSRPLSRANVAMRPNNTHNNYPNNNI